MQPIKINQQLPEVFLNDVRSIIESGRRQAYSAAGSILLTTYWNIGRRIVEEEQKGNSRAEYGRRLIADLADNLKKEYGPGYGKRNLAYFRRFYLSFPDIEILHEFVQNLINQILIHTDRALASVKWTGAKEVKK